VIKVRPDFQASPNLNFIHRVVDDADIYFVARHEEARYVVVRIPCRWPPARTVDAETGTVEPATMWNPTGSTVELTLEPRASIFVVFRRPVESRRPRLEYGEIVSPYDPDFGAPPQLVIKKAVYGALDRANGGTVDVTAKLGGLVNNGHLKSPRTTISPAIRRTMWSSNCEVDYVLDGKSKSITVRENEELELPTGVLFNLLPAPRLSTEDGKVWLTAAGPGRYRLFAGMSTKQLQYPSQYPTSPSPPS